MSTKLNQLKKQLKGKSFRQIVVKAMIVISWKFFIKARGYLLKYTQLSVDKSILEQFKLSLREVSPQELNLLSDKEFYSKRIWDNRWHQGAHLLGAIWQGKIVEYCWVVFEGSYRDIFDGFYIKLNPGECYLFDYRALKTKPEELRHFKIMKVLGQFVFDLMNERFPDSENVCYVLVEENNKKSSFFFKHHFQAKLVANVMLYKLLRWKFSSRKDVAKKDIN